MWPTPLPWSERIASRWRPILLSVSGTVPKGECCALLGEHRNRVGAVVDNPGVEALDVDGLSTSARREVHRLDLRGGAHGFTLTAARPRVPSAEMAQARNGSTSRTGMSVVLWRTTASP